ncbi:FG-GAP repeat protein [Spirosoma gilvum]
MKHFSFTQLLRSSLLLWSLLLTAISLPATAQSWDQISELVASDPSSRDAFGNSVSISGNYAIIGNMQKNNSMGAAYIFTRTGSTWTQQAKLTPSDAATFDRFGISVSISGDYAIVGADLKNNTGAAYVFVRTGTTWTQQAMLTASDTETSDQFGTSVSISGNYAVVGADQKNNGMGAAYTFSRTGTTWTQQTKLTALDGVTDDNFGASVSISGDYTIVGADQKNNGTGAAYVFTRSGTTWTQQAKLTASNADANENFGASVSISGAYVIVGAPSGNTFTGAAYTFSRTGITWTQQTKLTAFDGASLDQFGNSVAISGDYALVGASDHNFSTGAAYGFFRTGAT